MRAPRGRPGPAAGCRRSRRADLRARTRTPAGRRRSPPGRSRSPGRAAPRPAGAPGAGSGCRRRTCGLRGLAFPASLLSRAGSAEQAVDVVLRQGRAHFLRHLDDLVAFSASDAARIAFDLEAPVGPEIGLAVDELARIESDPGQAVVERRGRQRLGDHHVRAHVARVPDRRLAGVAGHDQDRHGAVLVLGVAADGARECEPAMGRQPRVAQEDIDLLSHQRLDHAERVLDLHNLVRPEAAQDPVHEHAQIGAGVRDQDHQVAQIDVGICHTRARICAGQDLPSQTVPRSSHPAATVRLASRVR